MHAACYNARMSKREPKLGDIVTIRGSEQRAVVVEYDLKQTLYGVFWVHAGTPNGAKLPASALDVADDAPPFDPNTHPAVVEKLALLGQQIAEVRAVGAGDAKLREELSALKGAMVHAYEMARRMVPSLPSTPDYGLAMGQVIELANTWREEGNEQIKRLQAKLNDVSPR